MSTKKATIPEILLGGLLKLGITSWEDLKVILLTLGNETNMIRMVARIEDAVDAGEKMDWSEALKIAISVRNSERQAENSTDL
jgi:hypothetical protein